MNTYKATIQYKGTAYQGWQIQPEARTVQGEINKALKKISKDEESKTLGSGRTDSGVHALGQVVKLSTSLSIGGPELTKAFNSLLPSDIQILKIEDAKESFHPIGDASWKEYIYLFSTQKSLNLFYKEFVAQAPAGLDFNKMIEACNHFVGSHDFSDFQCVGTKLNTSVREIFECEVSPYSGRWGVFPKVDGIMMLRVRGSGFLKQMVRLLAGTLWNVGQGKTSLDELASSMKTPLGRKLGPVAPAHGLYLKEVFYPSKQS